MACPSDHSVRVVRPTITTASGIWRRRRAPADARAARPRRHAWPPHAPSMCPPTTAAAGPSREPRRQPRPVGSKNAVPNRFQPAGTDRRSRPGSAGRRSAGTSGSGRSGSRARSAAGPRPIAPSPTDRATTNASSATIPRKPTIRIVPRRVRGPKSVEEDLGLRQAVVDDRRRRARPHHDSRRPAGSSSPLPNGRAADAPVLADQREWASRPSRRNQTVKISPCARHASRPNWAISRASARCSRGAR